MIKQSIKLIVIIFAGMLAITSCSNDNNEVVVTPTTELTVNPKTKYFGSREVNTSFEQFFVVKNTGKNELKITSFTFEGANKSEFTTTGKVTTVAVGKTYKFNITFKPTSEGGKKATLFITSNAGRTGVALTGKGTKATTTPPSGSSNVITGAGAISTSIPSSLGAPYTTANGFNRYTKLTAPNGKAIHIVAQNNITDEQIRRCQNILQHYLTNLPGSTYGANKTAVANKMGDNNAILCLLNGQDDGSNPMGTQVTGQPLYQNEIQVEGHSWYMNQNYEHRDAAYEEILHFVHDNGIGVDTNGTPSPRGAAPEFQKLIRAAQKNGSSKNLWGIGSADWIKELTAENSLSQEYLASVVDSYYGLWGAWKGSATHGMWGMYVGKTRADIKTDDPMGYDVMDNKFFHSYITYNARIDASLNGNFSLKFDASKPYTHHSRYLKDITLLGSNNNTVTVNEMNNDITGNSGTNTIIFSGKQSEYKVNTANGVTTVTDNTANRDGVNTLRNVEKLQFTDATVSL